METELKRSVTCFESDKLALNFCGYELLTLFDDRLRASELKDSFEDISADRPNAKCGLGIIGSGLLLQECSDDVANTRHILINICPSENETLQLCHLRKTSSSAVVNVIYSQSKLVNGVELSTSWKKNPVVVIDAIVKQEHLSVIDDNVSADSLCEEIINLVKNDFSDGHQKQLDNFNANPGLEKSGINFNRCNYHVIWNQFPEPDSISEISVSANNIENSVISHQYIKTSKRKNSIFLTNQKYMPNNQNADESVKNGLNFYLNRIKPYFASSVTLTPTILCEENKQNGITTNSSLDSTNKAKPCSVSFILPFTPDNSVEVGILKQNLYFKVMNVIPNCMKIPYDGNLFLDVENASFVLDGNKISLDLYCLTNTSCIRNGLRNTVSVDSGFELEQSYDELELLSPVKKPADENNSYNRIKVTSSGFLNSNLCNRSSAEKSQRKGRILMPYVALTQNDDYLKVEIKFQGTLVTESFKLRKICCHIIELSFDCISSEKKKNDYNFYLALNELNKNNVCCDFDSQEPQFDGMCPEEALLVRKLCNTSFPEGILFLQLKKRIPSEWKLIHVRSSNDSKVIHLNKLEDAFTINVSSS